MTTNDQTLTGQQLAQQHLAAQSEEAADIDDAAEVAQSDKLAETLQYLQNLIERNATQLKTVRDELREKRESLQNILENDQELTEAETVAKAQVDAVKQRKATLQSSPESINLKNEVGELREKLHEIEDTLNSHLLNYYQLTNSTSFDTSDGDQWDFTVKAKLKSR